jgi:hypothetical protein
MSYESREGMEPSEDLTPEGERQPDLDLIIEHWICIAALAWMGSVVRGPGAVVLTIEEDGTQPSYWAGSPCTCHPIGPDTYNPREQVLVVVHRDTEASVPILVSGWPSPPDAYAVATAEMMGGTQH